MPFCAENGETPGESVCPLFPFSAFFRPFFPFGIRTFPLALFLPDLAGVTARVVGNGARPIRTPTGTRRIKDRSQKWYRVPSPVAEVAVIGQDRTGSGDFPNWNMMLVRRENHSLPEPT
jgi:hypothetical protein